ncbi:threonine/homoserine efflux transporter RhtA [Palleronia aestuarii]|uniref:Threonine/homoserine efflux transporter RhtA n=1 Tax=Palleronia aestuarii TaxID=568105 RepID=A0A2W7NFT5_9RHOB|nr:DMT family transporter [Palleronia aestuarii]PZX18780.1 threonine/homoserine efflux transporter RhtA [Palleronia aestuarii]
MDLRALLLGLAFAVMWSSAFTSAKMIVADAPPLTALALRFALAGIIGVGVARALGQSWHLTRAQWRATFLFGLCQNALYLGLNFIAMRTIDAGLASIIASTMPLLVAFAGWFVLGERLRAAGLAGLFVGFVGVALIMGSRISGGVDLQGLSLCIGGVLALTLATLAVRGASSGGNLLMVVGLQMLVGSAILAVVALVWESWDVRWSLRLVLAFLYTTLIPGLAATFAWFVLVGRIGPTKAATFHFLNPFLGVLIAAAILGERIGPLDILGVAIIAAGIFAVQTSKPPPAPEINGSGSRENR